MTDKECLLLKFHDEVNMGHLEVVQQLIGQGADVNGKDALGNTPLMSAAYTGQDDMVCILLASRADVTAKGFDSKTAKDLAQELGHQKVLLVLGEHGTGFKAKATG